MKKLIVIIAAVAVVSASYLFGRLHASKVVSAPPAAWANGNPAAEAWRELLVSLDAAGAQVFSATDDTRERLDGLRHLTQLLSASLEMKFAKGDPASPRFTDWMSDYRKILGDSPDAVYHTAEISSAHRYEISGNVGEADYLGFMLYGSSLNGWNRAGKNLSQDEISIDENGNFRIILSKTKPGNSNADWLKLEHDIHMIMARQYFHDRPGSTPAMFDIRLLDAVEINLPTEETVATSLRRSTGFFNDTLSGVVALAEMLSAQPNNPDPPKAYNQDFGGIFYPTHDNEYIGTWFKIAEDEALVIEGDVPNAAYWSASLQNRWLQSLDHDQHPVNLNNRSIKIEDGRYRIVVSHRKPSEGNWLSTAGYREGILAIRYQQPEGTTRLPTLTLVRFEDL